ncbi:uncharacterized protein LAJ45_04670 [Morchella importuna]|uniref:uncharacterized protein n=1 Tax=Morchella importuna TaxID=1174673 RepID=UPI001E8E93AF|nr:uncharacterized protein LAJ45_04670 [Morchella importuna]KAH8151465.1 hypothetical protein LAJ45_04670 [Morchella importuna]
MSTLQATHYLPYLHRQQQQQQKTPTPTLATPITRVEQISYLFDHPAGSCSIYIHTKDGLALKLIVEQGHTQPGDGFSDFHKQSKHQKQQLTRGSDLSI